MMEVGIAEARGSDSAHVSLNVNRTRTFLLLWYITLEPPRVRSIAKP
jgi:hypothetical protein